MIQEKKENKKVAILLVGVLIIIVAALGFYMNYRSKQAEVVLRQTEESQAGEVGRELTELPTTPQELADSWMRGFAERDGQVLYQLLADKEIYGSMPMAEITEDGKYLLGWSSPWPFGGGETYQVQESEQRIQIRYPAVTSDPHIILWIETLQYEEKNGEYLVTKEELLFGEEIDSKEMFTQVYAQGLIDYENSGVLLEESGTLAEALYENSKTGNEAYQKLHTPAEAAAYLLNLSGGSAEQISESGGEAVVEYTWEGEEESITVSMKQIGEENSIWIPKKLVY